jgi:hypothetical protein
MSNSINTHFKRESKIMFLLFAAPFIMGVIVIIYYSLFAGNPKIDRCLDSGGSFNYESCQCDYKKNHKYIEDHKC